MLVSYKMDWMVEYFMHRARTWDSWVDRATQNTLSRARAYVHCQSAVWKSFALATKLSFDSVCMESIVM